MLTLTAAPPVPPDAAYAPLRITAAQFAANAEAGVYPPGRKVELLDGVVVLRDARARSSDPPSDVGPQHSLLTKRARKILEPLAEAAGAIYRDSEPVLLPPYNGPQPDGAIVAGTDEDYAHRQPESGDVLLLLEVADSSYRNDSTTKVRIYAETGVPVYWLLRVPTRTLEVFTDPDPAAGVYRALATLTAADAAAVPLPGGVAELPLADLLGGPADPLG